MMTATLPCKVLLAVEVSVSFRQALAACYEILGPLARPFERSVGALSTMDRQSVRAVLTASGIVISSRVIEALPALGLICCRGSGYDGIDLRAARKRGIAITHGPGLNSSSVADLAMGLLIASVRKMTIGREYIEQRRWRDDTIHQDLRVRGLTGRRLGIYGLGAIGSKIAQRSASFEMEVAYHNRRPRQNVPYPYFASLVELARWADVLVVAVRANADNWHAVNHDILAALGHDGFVINIARGSVIDEAALVHALSAGIISGAGLDVFENEPAVPQALLTMPHVAVTPHMGGDTEEAQESLQRLVLANLEAFFSGKPLVTPLHND